MNEMRAKSCWTTENARAVLVTEALAGHDALFLATHTPVRGVEVGGSANDVEEPSEDGLLRALSDPARQHAFCVIQGEPGSGKSHLIRWLAVNWAHDSDLTLLVQRANGSLEGALRQLQTRLPDEFQHLFDNLGRRQAAALSGRAAQFLVTLGASLAHDYFAQPHKDAGWCRENDPSLLLLNTAVRQQWSGPKRILKLMDGGAGERNSATASFNLHDIIDLARFCIDVHDSVASERLARRLKKEAGFIEEQLALGRTPDQIKLDSSASIRTSLALIDALNLRRNYAVQHVIGVSADGLKRLFEDLRIALGRRNRRLVLLLEDITSWEGLDDSLIDVLVTDAGTRQDADLCPLVSVVGVTPEYFSKLQGNYRQRITHEIRLGQLQGQLQDVAALREAEDRTAFVARYLNAARAGLDELREWRERFRSERELPPPNRCKSCPRAEWCHGVFGDEGGIGLFPFTREALDNFFFALKENDTGMTHRTPRGMLQAVLSPTLLNPKIIDQGHYPGPQLETSALERRLLPAALQSRISAEVIDVGVRDRLRRLLSYWGDLRPELRRDNTGKETYAGVSPDLLAAFDLPWIAQDATLATQREKPFLQPDTPTSPPKPASLPVTGQTPSTPRPRQEPARIPAGPVARGPTRTELDRSRTEIAALREGQPLQNSTTWNRILFDILGTLDTRQLGIDRWTWSKLFTPETVKIAGTGQTRAAHFVVERSAWLADGLEAYASLKTTDLTEEESEYSRRRLAFLVFKLQALALAHVNRRLPQTSTGARWNPVTTAVQTLVSRAWLRGTTSPDKPTHEQWIAALSDEAEAESDPNARTQSWQDFLSATKNRHDLIRKAMLEMVRLPIGGVSGFGVTDASVAASALVSLRERCALSDDAVPLANEQLPSDLEVLAEVGSRLASLHAIPHQELKLLSGRADQLFSFLRDQSLTAHLHRLDVVITDVSNQIRGGQDHLVKDWKTALERQRHLISDRDLTIKIENLIVALSNQTDELPDRRSSLLAWLADAPAADLKAALDLSQLGERVVIELLPHVRDLVTESDHVPQFTQIREFGRLLKRAASTARESLVEEAQ